MLNSFNVKKRLRDAVIDMFSHGNDPMKHTFSFKGDPGLFGPSSVTWRIISDVSGFMGGIRALYLQAAHPEVVAGVYQHSNYREDPFGRLSRTGDYVAVTAFGATPEVTKMIAHVKRMHHKVTGVSARNKPYSGNDPALASWVHNSLVDSFLVAYQLFGDTPLSQQDADAFVNEQTQVGTLMGANELPTTANDLTKWITEHPSMASTNETKDVLNFLNHPPLPRTMRIGYSLLKDAAIGSFHPKVQAVINHHPPRLWKAKGRVFITLMRTSLGVSPARDIAMQRLAMTP
jgi:uncharacterized protein (DUF2236 family)